MPAPKPPGQAPKLKPRKPAPFASEDENDYSRPGDRSMSADEFHSEAKKNFEASQVAYTVMKNKARMATSVGVSGSVPQVSK